ncbi:hypothetical protein V6N13_028329 [Hibiscus sabdariffa]
MKTSSEIIRSRRLLQWFDNIREWSAELHFDSRFTWLVVDGLPIQTWSTSTFRNIAETWGLFLKIDKDTAEPQSFENGYVFIEMTQIERINETIDLVVNGEIIPIRVWEVEYPYKSENSEDLSVGVSVDEDESTHVQSDLGAEAVVSETSLHPAHISNSKSVNSKETMVPNSYEMNYDQTRLEQSKRVDLRVCDSQTIGTEVVSDAYTGLIIRIDLELPKLDVMQLTDLHVSPIAHTTGPLVDNSDTLPRAIRIKIGAADRKVRYLDDLMQRETTTKKQPALKRGRGRPRK